MIIVKITVIAWVLYFIIKFFVMATMSAEDRLLLHINNDVTPGMCLLVLWLFICIVLTAISAVWFLFFYLP